MAHDTAHEMKNDAVQFQIKLEHEIPIAKAMGVEVKSLTTDGVAVCAPLAPNINHKRTAFGGSVNTVAVLSCWSLVTYTIQESPFEADYIVIQDSQIDYKAPIDGDFEAESRWESEAAKEKFFSSLERRGLARVTLKSEVRVNGKVCAVFTGRFVAQTDALAPNSFNNHS